MKKVITIKVADESDVVKAMKKMSRELYGFEASKVFCNKKKYNRKRLKKVSLED